MMMHCLRLGGMSLYYDRDNEERLARSLTKNQNCYYYEMALTRSDEWPAEVIRGKCVKAMGITALGKGLSPIRCVYMQRDPVSQYKSSKSSLRNVDSRYEYWVEKDIQELSESDEIEDLVVFDYDEVLSDPSKAFETLVQHGWPIDPWKASVGVDRSMKHF